MLVLTRQEDQAIVIGDGIIVRVVSIKGDKVRLGVEAPKGVGIHRQEIYEAIQRENMGAAADAERQRVERLRTILPASSPGTSSDASGCLPRPLPQNFPVGG